MNTERISLQAARQRAGLTIEEAAERINVGVNSIKAWEAGKHRPRGFMLNRIYKAYNAKPGSIDTLKTEPACATMLDKALADPELIRSTITAYLCPRTIDPGAGMLCGGRITDDWPPDEMCERCWRQAARA